jgi:amino acid transporter
LDPGNAGTAKASPWVIAIDNAQIKVLPSIVNAVILISAWSAGNSDLYAASRTLYALSLEGKFPKIFRKCTRGGLPIYSVVLTGLFGCLAYLSSGGDTATKVFDWLYNISAISGLLTWWTILISYLRFYYGLKKQGLSRDSHPYRAPWQPWLSWYGLIWFTLILFLCGFTVFLEGNWDTSSFFAS